MAAVIRKPAALGSHANASARVFDETTHGAAVEIEEPHVADAYPVSDRSSAVMINAADLAADHQLAIWDSVIIAATAEAGCRLLLSEDLQEGFSLARRHRHQPVRTSAPRTARRVAQ
jgi:predicted nucleic acid-binding protein